ncbi:release factor glutamine methyltransferase [Trueperella bonasi]|uniref:peptide chain release factor N(5)-glutamine methyltransferase n=1 Tax=Trueperella bonasi TaxID=312286 RepID=A0ABT9NH76_9ACTO|nr:peptide chain release factor N(5)-glutamine methyltransferase [Trueperella bonasi]MDP9806746.1 release factor glutamine methyltransferase [Trueperella bonasi]
MSRTWAHALEVARTKLAAAVESADVDARLLAEFVHGGVPSGSEMITDAEVAAFEQAVSQREKRVPLQHITGTMYFRYLELESGPGTFVVRPETEMVVEAVIEEIACLAAQQSRQRPVVVDLCTGSGAIALAIATETSAQVMAVELSEEAHESASRNSARYGHPITLIRGDALSAFEELAGRVDVVVSNPPYVRGDEELAPEVTHDPQIALFGGGDDGLEMPTKIIARAHYLLRVGGILIMEHGEEQSSALRGVARRCGFGEVSTGQDLTGRDRWLRARKDEA